MKKFKNGQKVQCVKTKEIGRIVDGFDLDKNSVYQVKWYKSGIIEAFVSENTLRKFTQESKLEAFFNKLFSSERADKIIVNILKLIFVVIVSFFLALVFNM